MTSTIRSGFTEIRPGLLEEIAFRDGSTIEIDESAGRAYVVTVEGYRYTAEVAQ